MKKILLFLFAMLLMGAYNIQAQTLVGEVTQESDGSYLLTFKVIDYIPTYVTSGFTTGFYAVPSTGNGYGQNPRYSSTVTENAIRTKITKAVFDESVKNIRPTCTTSWFANLGGLQSIEHLDYLNTSDVTVMNGMFGGCSSLRSIDLSHFDTSKVEDMAYLFRNCRALTALVVTKFNTQNVTTMRGMFNECQNLKFVDVTGFDTGKVTTMESMFLNCYSLNNLDVTKFDTRNVTNMSTMFSGCRALSKIDVSNFNTQKVTTMGNMFADCQSFTTIDISNFDTPVLESTGSMFSGCKSLRSITFGGKFNTENVTYMGWMFNDCRSLMSVDVSKFNMKNVTSISQMFYNCRSLKSLDLSNPTILNVPVSDGETTKYIPKDKMSIDAVIRSCSGLTELKLGINDFSRYKITDIRYFPCTAVGQKDTPCHLTRTFSRTKLGTATIVQDENVPPYYNYCDGYFTIADTLDCMHDYKPSAKDTVDLWHKDRAIGTDGSSGYALYANEWNTFVLPASLTAEQRNASFGSGAEVCVLSGYDGKKVIFKTLEGDIPANTPVLVKPSKNVKNLGYVNVNIAPVGENGLIVTTTKNSAGSYATFYGSYEANKQIGNDCFYYYDNRFLRSAGNSHVRCTRGYFKFSDVKESTGATGAKIFVIDDGSTVTRIDAIDGKPVSTDGAVYNLSGQRVGDDYKGIVIVNGRKVLRR